MYELALVFRGRLQSIIIRNSLESFLGTAPSALKIIGVFDLSASAKWSSNNPFFNLRFNLIFCPGF